MSFQGEITLDLTAQPRCSYSQGGNSEGIPIDDFLRGQLVEDDEKASDHRQLGDIGEESQCHRCHRINVA